MKTFLEEVAGKIYKDHQKLENVTVVFPNRRATLYFRKHLSGLINKPTFAPKIQTIEDFFSRYSNLQIPDKLVLISVLFKAYTKVMDSVPAESDSESIGQLEEFYFWGEMLLRDFDEIDKYLVSAEQLFKDLSHQKELDSSFDFLTEEQQEFLKGFWSNFDVDQSVNKRRFLRIWRQLFRVYSQFKDDLVQKGFAYEGMLHRSVSEMLKNEGPQKIKVTGPIVFAGFNALTAAEEMVISFFVEHFSATVHWDLDAYYVNSKVQEAGLFFREYQGKPVLGKTFDQDIPANFQEKILSRKEVQG